MESPLEGFTCSPPLTISQWGLNFKRSLGGDIQTLARGLLNKPVDRCKLGLLWAPRQTWRKGHPANGIISRGKLPPGVADGVALEIFKWAWMKFCYGPVFLLWGEMNSGTLRPLLITATSDVIFGGGS